MWLVVGRKTMILGTMGPTILLDKSALQSIGIRGISELRRYFGVTVPPVLLLEVLADLEKAERTQTSPSDEVRVLARKLSHLGGVAFVNVDFRFVCLNELLGYVVRMDRVPIVGGARIVRTPDGRQGSYLPRQPEMEAALRWSRGQFSETDRANAAQWRARLKAFNPDSFRRSLPPLVKKATSLAEASRDAEQLLGDDEGQQLLLRWFIRLVSPEAASDVVREWTFRRWRACNYEQLVVFAPYSRHCLKVMLLFHLAFANALISTTRSSWVDAEYLCYTSFAHVFCSRDRLHQELASFALGEDQSFVPGDTLLHELRSLAEQRHLSKTEGAADVRRTESVEPGEASCIRALWVRHLGAFRPQSSRQRRLSDDERRRIMEEVRPIVEAMQRDNENVHDSPWPS